jgi:hypothetical protein
LEISPSFIKGQEEEKLNGDIEIEESSRLSMPFVPDLLSTYITSYSRVTLALKPVLERHKGRRDSTRALAF